MVNPIEMWNVKEAPTVFDVQKAERVVVALVIVLTLDV